MRPLCGTAKAARTTSPSNIPCTTWSLANAACWRRELAELKPDVSLAERTFRLRAKTAQRWHRDHPRQTQKNKTQLTASRNDQLRLAVPVHPVDLQESGMRRHQCRDHRREPDPQARPLLRRHAGSPRSAETTDRFLESAMAHDHLEAQRPNPRALRPAHRPTPILMIGRRSIWVDSLHSCTVSMRL
mgnify:CR=1 FL=1